MDGASFKKDYGWVTKREGMAGFQVDVVGDEDEVHIYLATLGEPGWGCRETAKGRRLWEIRLRTETDAQLFEQT
jgi:hypothetical protein